MTGREFNIPYGPDRTGGFDLSKVVPEVVPADVPAVSEEDVPAVAVEGAAAPAPDVPSVDAAQPASVEESTIDQPTMAMTDLPQAQEFAAQAESASSDGYADEPVADPFAAPEPPADEAARSAATIISPDFGSSAGDADSASEDQPADDEPGEERSQAIEGVQRSFLALKDSIGQGRELKARERELGDLEDKIAADREELADRDDILANYQAIVAEQDAIISQNTLERDAKKSELSHVVANTEDVNEELARLRDYHDKQLDPYETALGRARAAADQAKNDERSRKSELNAAESEARRAEKGDASTMAQARLETVKAAHEEAVARSAAAKEALDEAQRAYDEIRSQVEQAEAPLERNLEDLQKRNDELKEEIANLGEVISTATKRRQYCDSVYQYPDETEKLRQAVADSEASARQMGEENDELRGLLEQSKANSTKAKIVLGAVAVIVIFIILLVWFLSSR